MPIAGEIALRTRTAATDRPPVVADDSVHAADAEPAVDNARFMLTDRPTHGERQDDNGATAGMRSSLVAGWTFKAYIDSMSVGFKEFRSILHDR